MNTVQLCAVFFILDGFQLIVGATIDRPYKFHGNSI